MIWNLSFTFTDSHISILLVKEYSLGAKVSVNSSLIPLTFSYLNLYCKLMISTISCGILQCIL